MNKLDRIQSEIDELRGRPANIRYRDLARIAQSLGMTLEPKRGGHLKFTNKSRNWDPLIIPCHPKALKKFTARGILAQLEDNLASLRGELEGYKNGE